MNPFWLEQQKHRFYVFSFTAPTVGLQGFFDYVLVESLYFLFIFEFDILYVYQLIPATQYSSLDTLRFAKLCLLLLAIM